MLTFVSVHKKNVDLRISTRIYRKQDSSIVHRTGDPKKSQQSQQIER